MATTQVTKRLFRECKYEFSAKELNEIAADACRANLEVQRLEGEKSASMKHYADVISAAKTRAMHLSHLREVKYEMRDIECEITLATPTKDLKTVTRLDTGEVVAEEKMEPADRQVTIEFKPPQTN